MGNLIIYTVALATTIGNMLQGWHGGAIAGALLYLKHDFNLEGKETFEGLIVSIALLGAFLSTVFAGPLADWVGRKSVLKTSAILYCLGSTIMSWSPNVYVLIMGRLVSGAAIGFASAISPLYISESSPTDIRGTLLTFPQMFGSIGMFLAYSLAFGLSLTSQPNWRIMLGVTLVPSLMYLFLCTWYIPESPRWLVSKGRMLEAKKVLQRLRKQEDVQVELALLVEGLGHTEETLKEYILCPMDGHVSNYVEHEGGIDIIGPGDEGPTWIATPLEGNTLSSFKGSLHLDNHRKGSHLGFLTPDPIVTLMDSLQTTPLGSRTGSAFLDITIDNPPTPSYAKSGLIDISQFDHSSLESPLLQGLQNNGEIDMLSESNTHDEEAMPISPSVCNLTNGSIKSINLGSFTGKANAEMMEANNIGKGWQLAWQWSQDEGELKRVFLHQEGIIGNTFNSMSSLPKSMCSIASGRDLMLRQASALVGTPAQSLKGLLNGDNVGPAMAHPLRTTFQGPAWTEMNEPSVKHGLFIGCTLQFLQQFSGLNAVLYYTPQILQTSSGSGFLSNISQESTSLLASAMCGLLMFPFILWAVRLMDVAGRRKILLYTLPLLSISLIGAIMVSTFLVEGLPKAIISFIVMANFICCFVMGFGPIPNILCAEIFPTRVRGLCNGICSSVMWLSTVVITYGFPYVVSQIGLNGVFSIFTFVSLVSWVFVYLKVPETKGMPLEVVTELLANFGSTKRRTKLV